MEIIINIPVKINYFDSNDKIRAEFLGRMIEYQLLLPNMYKELMLIVEKAKENAIESLKIDTSLI